MKAITVLFDSLNLKYLSCYGCDWTITHNFKRLAGHCVTFDHAFVGSMPCMPARRELHTGRYNFFHRSWGPIEPFDDSAPSILSGNGVYTHLITDHHHYWEDGGATYHTRYNSAELIRGREGDPWKGFVSDPILPEFHHSQRTDTNYKQEFWNRTYFNEPHEQPQYLTMSAGIEFMENNSLEDNWFLQIEIFDPHEPFFAPEKYQNMYQHEYKGAFWDWPQYKKCDESKEDINHIRMQYAALVTMCDENLGRFLDKMDELDLWSDTMLIVSTDHGYSLGENGWWAKMFGGWYNTTANIPFFVWDPRYKKQNIRSDKLVQWIDIPATLLEYFSLEIPEDMQGKSMKPVIRDDDKIHDFAAFGMFGGQANVTDGRFVYMRAPVNKQNKPLYEYTLMPSHLCSLFTVEEMKSAEYTEPFNFTKGCRLLKVPGSVQNKCTAEYWSKWETLLFDNQNDYGQEHPIKDENTEKVMRNALIHIMGNNDAPEEQYIRLGLPVPKGLGADS